LANALDPQKVVVLAPPNAGAKTGDEKIKYKVIRKKILLPKFIWPRWLALLWQVGKIIKKEKIELIMVHHALPIGYAGLWHKKFHHVPFVLFSHGTDLITGTANKWKAKLLSSVANGAEQIIFNSESLKRRFLEKMPEFDNQSLVLYPCPDRQFFSPPDQTEIEKLRSLLALQGKQTILSVARLDEGKGFPHLIRLLPKLLQKMPHLVWLIVGDGPKRETIVKLIQKNNLQNVVRFVGEVSHEELKKYYYLVDLFVLLTHPDGGREEGLGLVFLEAAAAGLPIIAGQSGGVEEAVLNGQNGYVVDVYQTDVVVEKIVELLNDKNKAKEMGEQGRQRMEQEFVWERQLEKIKRLIED